MVESGVKLVARTTTETSAEEENSANSGSVNIFEGLGGGQTQMQTMHLLIKTQLLICTRYPDEMSKYKYPAYKMLLGCLEIPASCHDLGTDSGFAEFTSSCLMNPERAQFVRTAADLVFHTCLVSPLNAEELIAEGGLPILESLVNFYVCGARFVCDKSTMDNLPKEKSDLIASESLVLDILSHLVHTISGMAFYESGRNGILSLKNPSRLSVNFRRCLECKFVGTPCRVEGTSAMKRFALEGVASMAKANELQDLLIGSGIMWPVIRHMLAFDPTLEGPSNQRDEDDVKVSQASQNELARLSARALGMLAGVMSDHALKTPGNEVVKQALDALLSAPIARMLRNKRSSELLLTLNTNVETPVRIWNVSMREELSRFLSRMENERPEGSCRAVPQELDLALTSFEYATLKNEVTVGGVYLRIFNALGGGREALREIPNSSLFAKQIISFIAFCMNQSTELGDGWIKLPETVLTRDSDDINTPNVSISDVRFSMAVKALDLLVRVDGLVDDVICDPTKQPTSVLLSLLEVPQEIEVRSDMLYFLFVSCAVAHKCLLQLSHLE